MAFVIAEPSIGTKDTADVYLCLKSFLDDMGVSFSKGDEIALTGSKVKQGEADLILAREVVSVYMVEVVVSVDDKANRQSTDLPYGGQQLTRRTGSSKVSITAILSSPTTNPALPPALPASVTIATHTSSPIFCRLKSALWADVEPAQKRKIERRLR
jgi:hypothetical protein